MVANEIASANRVIIAIEKKELLKKKKKNNKNSWKRYSNSGDNPFCYILALKGVR